MPADTARDASRRRVGDEWVKHRHGALAPDIGPLNPPAGDLVLSAALFAMSHVVNARLLRRINRVLDAREQATRGVGRRAEEVRAQAEARRQEARSLLAEARHGAARIRQRAQEQRAVLIAAARAGGVRTRDGLLARARARIEAREGGGRGELRAHLPELAAGLASRMVGEPISPASRTPAADTR